MELCFESINNILIVRCQYASGKWSCNIQCHQVQVWVCKELNTYPCFLGVTLEYSNKGGGPLEKLLSFVKNEEIVALWVYLSL